MLDIRQQLERVRKHYESAMDGYDPISLADLAHSLRTFTEGANGLKETSPEFWNSPAFVTASPSKKTKSLLRGGEYAYLLMPNGVKLRTGKKQSIDITFNRSNKRYLLQSTKFRSSVGATEWVISHCNIVNTSREITETDRQLFAHQHINETRLNYSQWINSEAVRVCFADDKNNLQTHTISRQMVIKRVANTLGGSHAVKDGDNRREYENRFDPAISALLSYRINNLPFVYVILLKIAQDILELSHKIFPAPPADYRQRW